MLRLMIPILILSACAPVAGLPGAADPSQSERRGAVELAVKSAFPGILADIDAGGGPALSQAFDAAGVPAGDRPARILQLRGDLGLYAASPGVLAAAIALFGA